MLALFGILQRRPVGALGHSKRERGDRDTPAVENAHGVDKAPALLAKKVFVRHKTIFEDQLRRIAGAQSELVFFFPRTKSFGALLDNERRKPVGVRRAIGYRQHDDRVRIVAVGDESLGAVEHPSALRPRRRHPRTARIRPRRGLGQPPRADVLAGGQLRHILLLLRLVSRHINVI